MFRPSRLGVFDGRPSLAASFGRANGGALIAAVLFSQHPPDARAAHGGDAVVAYCNSGVKLGFPAGWCGFFARHSWNANIVHYSGPLPTDFLICSTIHTSTPVNDSNWTYGHCNFRGTVVWTGNNAESFYYLGAFNGDRGPHTFYTRGVN